MPANIASCIREFTASNRELQACRKLALNKPMMRARRALGSVSGSPTTSQLDPVLYASRVTTRGCCFVKHIKQWLELRIRDLATSSRLLRCHSPILVRDEVAFSELRLIQWCGQGGAPPADVTAASSAIQRSEVGNENASLQNMEAYFVHCRSAPSATSLCMEYADLAKRANYGPSQGKD